MRLTDCQSHSVISLSIIGNRLMLLINTKQHVSYNETILLRKPLNSYSRRHVAVQAAPAVLVTGNCPPAPLG